jgi:hypothetical protein
MKSVGDLLPSIFMVVNILDDDVIDALREVKRFADCL